MTCQDPSGLLLGDTRLAGVEQIERSLDRLAHRPFRGRADRVALLEGLVDGLGEIGVRHAGILEIDRARLVGVPARGVKGMPRRPR